VSDFLELDFWSVEAPKSGDAISVRYRIGDEDYVHVIDGGYQKTGESLAENISKYYGQTKFIDHVVATHNDGDHAGGLRVILDTYTVGTLWMLRPWLYAEQLLPYFNTYSSAAALKSRLRALYANLVELETIALRKGIDIREPFQGAKIGIFEVLSPTHEHFARCILASEKTPESDVTISDKGILERAIAKLANKIKAAWGVEVFPEDETSAENEMSVVQYAEFNGTKILLTADVGRAGLLLAIKQLVALGVPLPGIDWFQVPHHGSRRNVNSSLLDALLGKKIGGVPRPGEELFKAIISSAAEDEDHPRPSVERAMIHRGAKVCATEGQCFRFHTGPAPDRGWGPIAGRPYPEYYEE